MYAYSKFIHLSFFLMLFWFISHYPLYAATLHVPSEYLTIQSAINASSNGDSILVAQGIYFENLTIRKNLTLGSMYMMTGNPIYISTTIIDGGYSDYESTVRYYAVDSSARLTGFTIQNGNAYGVGGGIYCLENGNPILSNLIIKNNKVYARIPFQIEAGAGIAGEDSNPVIRNCRIFNNKADLGGSIALFYGSNARIENCHIWGNTTNVSGGGIYITGGSVIIENCVIRGNSSGLEGGGITCHGSARIINSLIINNTSANGGAISTASDQALELINVSIVGNRATEHAGAIYLAGNQSVSMHNAILRNNSPEEIYHASMGEFGIEYSDIKNGFAGIGGNTGNIQWSETNIDLDPGFNAANGMAYIRDASSPVIDAGNPDTTGLGLPPLDLAGNPRIIGGRIDMGAFEYSGGPHAMLPPAPRFVQYPPAGTTATTFIFDAYPTTDNVDSLWGLQFRWDWEGDGAWDTPFSHNYVGEHAFSHAGSYAVTLEVKDSDGLTSTARENLTMGATVTHNFNEEISFTIPGEQSLISIPFPDAVISIRFLFGDVMGKTVRITAFGGDPPQNVHNGPRFAKVIGYYSIYSTSISSFTGTLSFAYTDSTLRQSGIAEEDLELAYWDERSKKWNALITTVDSAGNKASATIDHFSLWALADRTDDLITGVHDDEAGPGTVTSYQLYQNYPNPFNPITAIRFDLPKAERVRIAIYNILGQRVRFLAKDTFAAGSHAVSWDGRDDGGRLLASGVYIYEIRAGEFIERKKMTMLR